MDTGNRRGLLQLFRREELLAWAGLEKSTPTPGSGGSLGSAESLRGDSLEGPSLCLRLPNSQDLWEQSADEGKEEGEDAGFGPGEKSRDRLLGQRPGSGCCPGHESQRGPPDTGWCALKQLDVKITVES